MQRILVTGGTGTLGRALVPKLQAAGYTVRVTSRQPPPERSDGSARDCLAAPNDHALKHPALEWACADVLTGKGVQASVRAVDIIIHAASNPTAKNMYAVEVEGTRNLVNAARAAKVAHFIYVSIVGIDRTPFAYYTAKLEAEKIVATFSARQAQHERAAWTILRGTQFFELIDSQLRRLARFPVAVIDPRMKFQPVDVREFSDKLVGLASQPAQGCAPDFGGPQILELDELWRHWLDAQQLRRAALKIRAPGRFADACRRAWNTNAQQCSGKTTWRAWLAAAYGQNGNGRHA